MALSIFEQALGKDRTAAAPPEGRGRRRFDYAKGYYVTSGAAARDKFAATAGRTLGAVQMVCDALIPPSAGRYTVVFGGETAMTERGKRRITVTPQPLYTKGMRLADVADTLTGFVVHEIGHVEISGETERLLSAWLDREPGYLPWRQSIHAISNVLDDHALEVWAKNRFPGVAHTFRVTTKFVAHEQDMPSRAPFQFKTTDKFTARFNFMVVSTRYRWFVRWASDPATRSEREWWINWIETYGDPADAALRLEGIKAGIARLAINPANRPDPEPEPPTTECGGLKSEDEGEDEGEDEPETFDTEDDESEDEGDEGEGDEDDESEEDFGQRSRSRRDEDDDESDEDEGEFESEGDESEDEGDESESEDDESEEGDEDEGDDEAGPMGLDPDEGSDLDSEFEDDRSEDKRSDERPEGGTLKADDLGKEGEGSSNAPIFDAFDPESFRDEPVIQTVDDYTEERVWRDKYRDDNLQTQVEVEMRAERITDTRGFGSMKVIINL